MAKEEKPLPYEGRVVDTKGVAQRIDLRYLERPNRFRDLKYKLAWILPIVALAGSLPFVTGIGPADKIFENAPVSRAHKIFEKDCGVCHSKVFSSVPDATCQKCHDGPSHPAKPADTAKLKNEPRCSTCHMEHRRDDTTRLADVASGHCTACHSNLNEHGEGIKLKNTDVRAFKVGKHPDFPRKTVTDARPIKLSHAAHMPKEPKTIRGLKLPMKCADCHLSSPGKPEMLPVTFDKHCKECHKRELEFLLPLLSGVNAPPAPHTKDGPLIRQAIHETYQSLLAKDPSLALRPLGREGTPEPNAAAWLERATRESERYLFQNKCKYCHAEVDSSGEFPQVRKVNKIVGRYNPANPEGDPWLERGEFNHRRHRAVTCVSCHVTATESKNTGDVLIPGMKGCVECHGSSGTSIDRCSQCHQYHNKYKELDRDRRPIDELIGVLDRHGLHDAL